MLAEWLSRFLENCRPMQAIQDARRGNRKSRLADLRGQANSIKWITKMTIRVPPGTNALATVSPIVCRRVRRGARSWKRFRRTPLSPLILEIIARSVTRIPVLKKVASTLPRGYSDLADTVFHQSWAQKSVVPTFPSLDLRATAHSAFP